MQNPALEALRRAVAKGEPIPEIPAAHVVRERMGATARLFVFNAKRNGGGYVLGWSTNGGATFTPAEPNVVHRTIKEARVHARVRFGEEPARA